jgi:hypothetical protein
MDTYKGFPDPIIILLTWVCILMPCEGFLCPRRLHDFCISRLASRVSCYKAPISSSRDPLLVPSITDYKSRRIDYDFSRPEPAESEILSSIDEDFVLFGQTSTSTTAKRLIGLRYRSMAQKRGMQATQTRRMIKDAKKLIELANEEQFVSECNPLRCTYSDGRFPSDLYVDLGVDSANLVTWSSFNSRWKLFGTCDVLRTVSQPPLSATSLKGSWILIEKCFENELVEKLIVLETALQMIPLFDTIHKPVAAAVLLINGDYRAEESLLTAAEQLRVPSLLSVNTVPFFICYSRNFSSTV